jgi:ribokinase
MESLVNAGRVYVVGSLNADLTVKVPRVPMPGETLLGGAFRHGCGGKGANQAVAAARAGASAVMIGAVGTDFAGDRLLAQLAADGIDTTHVARAATATGLAVVYVDDEGENSIAVVPGANLDCTPQHVSAALQNLAAADVVLAQGEIPASSIAAAAESALVAVHGSSSTWRLR